MYYQNPNQRQIRSNQGTIKNINRKRLAQRDNKKISNIAKMAVVGVSLSAVMFLCGLVGYNLNNKSDKPVEQPISLLPEDCIMLNIPVDVAIDDDVSDYVSILYNENYEGIYPSKESYEASVLKTNSLYSTTFRFNETINLPIIVETNNDYYIKIQELMDQIREIEEKEYYVDHVVGHGETISYYAYQASGSYNEAHELMDIIMRKNGLSSPNIYVGDKLKIINPELGALKVELQEVIKEYFNSLEITKGKSH